LRGKKEKGKGKRRETKRLYENRKRKKGKKKN